ncbi:MAG: hypothetical protein M3345_04625 [Actinomycetota bacterium]|nr:hypothetical protein [Actinomycetota bacterium]
MTFRIAIVTLAVLVGTALGAAVTTTLRNPTRTVVQPIELRPAAVETAPNDPRTDRRPGRRPRSERDPNRTHPPSPVTAAPSDEPGAAPAPAPVPAPAGGDDDDDDDGDDGDD